MRELVSPLSWDFCFKIFVWKVDDFQERDLNDDRGPSLRISMY